MSTGHQSVTTEVHEGDDAIQRTNRSLAASRKNPDPCGVCQSHRKGCHRYQPDQPCNYCSSRRKPGECIPGTNNHRDNFRMMMPAPRERTRTQGGTRTVPKVHQTDPGMLSCTPAPLGDIDAHQGRSQIALLDDGVRGYDAQDAVVGAASGECSFGSVLRSGPFVQSPVPLDSPLSTVQQCRYFVQDSEGCYNQTQEYHTQTSVWDDYQTETNNDLEVLLLSSSTSISISVNPPPFQVFLRESSLSPSDLRDMGTILWRPEDCTDENARRLNEYQAMNPAQFLMYDVFSNEARD